MITLTTRRSIRVKARRLYGRRTLVLLKEVERMRSPLCEKSSETRQPICHGASIQRTIPSLPPAVFESVHDDPEFLSRFNGRQGLIQQRLELAARQFSEGRT